MKRVSFKWGEGYLIVYEERGDLMVEAANSRIAFSPREIRIEGLYEGMREYVEGGRGEWKIVYIDLAFPLQGVERPRDVAFSGKVDTYIGSYGLSYTSLEGVGNYLTVYPPPGSLYDHTVVYDDGIALRMLSRRKVYVMAEDNTRKIILL